MNPEGLAGGREFHGSGLNNHRTRPLVRGSVPQESSRRDPAGTFVVYGSGLNDHSTPAIAVAPDEETHLYGGPAGSSPYGSGLKRPHLQPIEAPHFYVVPPDIPAGLSVNEYRRSRYAST